MRFIDKQTETTRASERRVLELSDTALELYGTIGAEKLNSELRKLTVPEGRLAREHWRYRQLIKQLQEELEGYDLGYSIGLPTLSLFIMFGGALGWGFSQPILKTAKLMAIEPCWWTSALGMVIAFNLFQAPNVAYGYTWMMARFRGGIGEGGKPIKYYSPKEGDVLNIVLELCTKTQESNFPAGPLMEWLEEETTADRQVIAKCLSKIGYTKVRKRGCFFWNIKAVEENKKTALEALGDRRIGSVAPALAIS